MSRPEVLVFVMEGCPACEQIKPLAAQLAGHYGACIDTRVLDVYEHDGFSDAMGVQETPTVIGVNPAKQPIVRMVGHDGKPDRLVRVFAATAATAMACNVPPFGDV